MKVAGIEWDEHNRAHFRSHRPQRCTFAEVEEVLTSRCFRARFREQAQRKPTEQRLIASGQTCVNKKFLQVVATPRPGQIMRPITCYSPDDSALMNYLEWRKSTRKR